MVKHLKKLDFCWASRCCCFFTPQKVYDTFTSPDGARGQFHRKAKQFGFPCFSSYTSYFNEKQMI